MSIYCPWYNKCQDQTQSKETIDGCVGSVLKPAAEEDSLEKCCPGVAFTNVWSWRFSYQPLCFGETGERWDSVGLLAGRNNPPSVCLSSNQLVITSGLSFLGWICKNYTLNMLIAL